MLFESCFSSFQVLVRPASDVYQHGVVVDEVRRLTAEFAHHDGMMTVVDEEGRQVQVPSIIGHFYDSVLHQERDQLTDDERELIEKALIVQCRKTPTWVWVKTAPVPVAPWKTYDSLTNYLKIATLAEELDCVNEALAYERATKNREGVVKALEEKLPAAEVEDSLTAA